MKQTLIILAITIQLTGCEKLFFEKPDTDIGHINSQEELETALTGLYNTLGQVYCHLELYNIQRVFGDDMHCNRPGSTPYSYNECYPNKWTILSLWSKLYKAIISSNNIIIQFENKNIDRTFKDYIGEAYLIRGYCYFNIARFFGKAVIIDNNDVRYNLTVSPLEKVYDFIEKNYIKAIEYLPDNNDQARTPFVTLHRGTAKAMLAEVYLTMAGYPLKDTSKYYEAAKIAKEVIDSAEFFGLELMQDFADLWDEKIKTRREPLFSLHFTTSEDYELNNFAYRYNWDESYANDGPYIFPEIKFYNDFPLDYRKDVTFHTTVCNLDQGIITYIYYKTIDKTVPMFYEKFAFSRDTTQSPYQANWFNTAHSICLYRYAHTLLTYAEARAHSGQLDASAYEAVNMIRRRANFEDIHSPSVHDLPPGLSAEQFADSIFWERAWELAGEPEGRWFDLLRLEMVDQLPELRYPEEIRPSVNEVTEEDYFLQIPEEETWLFSDNDD